MYEDAHETRKITPDHQTKVFVMCYLRNIKNKVKALGLSGFMEAIYLLYFGYACITASLGMLLSYFFDKFFSLKDSLTYLRRIFAEKAKEKEHNNSLKLVVSNFSANFALLVLFYLSPEVFIQVPSSTISLNDPERAKAF